MRFRPFLKMASAGEPREQPSPSGSWVALEKLHGAQLVLGVQNGAVHFGKRKAWLEEDDSFFGWQLLRLPLGDAALRAVQALGLGDARVYLYGELLGGRYPHPEVPAVPGMMPVQTGIWYAPDLHWVLFDVLVARSDEDEGVMLSHREVELAAKAAGVLAPPLVARGTRAQMETLPTRGTTRLPAMLGLPALTGNWAEGLVIKSEQPVAPAKRVAFKRKIEEFNEGRFDESTAWDAHQRLSFTELQEWSSRLVNPARIASALSKCGPADPEALLSEVELDVRLDLELAFPTACQSLDPASEERLSSHVRELARPLIQALRRT